MKSRIVTLMILVISMTFAMNVNAQVLKFGHINSQELLTQLPEMEAALKKLETLNTNNNEQLTKMQAEMKTKTEAFIAEQATLTELIKAQRQQELQQMDQNVRAFYQAAQQEMQTKEQELTVPIIEKARVAVEEVGKENGFTYIFDISKGGVIFQGVQSVDVMPLVKKKLGLLVN